MSLTGKMLFWRTSLRIHYLAIARNCKINLPTFKYHVFDLQNGKRDKATVIYNTSLGVVFGVPKYAQTLHDQILER